MIAMKLVMEMFKKYRVTEDGRLYKPKLFSHFGDSKLMHYTGKAHSFRCGMDSIDI
jgi:hypothetical protein